MEKYGHFTLRACLAGICIVASVLIVSALLPGVPGTVESGAVDGTSSRSTVALLPPPFISVIGYASAELAPLTADAGTAFPADRAGISAYVSTGTPIDLSNAASVCTGLEEVGDNYVIGNYTSSYLDYKIYADTSGNVVAYAPRYNKYTNSGYPASAFVNWTGMDATNPQITDSAFHAGIKTVLSEVVDNDIRVLELMDTVQYYDFEYPDATTMMLFVNRVPEGGTELVHYYAPSNTTPTTFESSYAFAIYNGRSYSDDNDNDAKLYIDDVLTLNRDILSSGIAWRIALDADTFAPDTPHTVKVWGGDDNGNNYAGVGFAFVILQ
ncbi:hypothetical protein [Methanofollis fontis]|uniref:Uncharacterized protein n=1 Tax=Methanofollis fontis TaxID=2052832 RepID=A0A483CTD6_9EURY|nr:hypothetical protein [Methanofollis fontis]TAJ44613.1 hypothetical protein CUJ86_04725 [Methanofollis fontis]